MGKYNFNRMVFVYWAGAIFLAGGFLAGSIRQVLGGPQLSASWLIYFIIAFALCCANTTDRELAMARLLMRKTRNKIATLYSFIRHLIPMAVGRIRNLSGLFVLPSNNNLQTEP